VLLTTIRQAAASGFDAHTWQLAWTLVDHCDREGLWHDQVAVQRIALHAARRSADLAGQAHAHHNLGSAYARLALLDGARPHLERALDLFIEIGDQTSQAHSHMRMAWVYHRLGRHEEVVHHDQQALDLYRAIGERAGQGGALNNIGWMHALLGDHEQAVVYCRQALAVHQETGDRAGEANAWDSLGFAYDGLLRHAEARVCYQRGIALFQQIGDRYFEANTLTHLGNCHMAVGDADSACDSWRHALRILDELEHPDADEVRAKLDQLART
jgi:tetratricopeptide (TPR) repeat protein